MAGEISLGILIKAALVDSINPCSLGIIILLAGILLISSQRKKIATNATIFILLSAVILFIVYAFNPISFTNFASLLSLPLVILIVLLGIFNLIYAFFNQKQGMHKIDGYASSFVLPIILVPLAVSALLSCTYAPAMTIVTSLTEFGTFFSSLTLLALYVLISLIPLIILSLVIYFLGARNSDEFSKIKWLKIIGGVLLLLSIL